VGGSVTTIKCIILTKIKFYLLIKILLEYPGRIIKKLAAGKQSEFGIAFVGGGAAPPSFRWALTCAPAP
jgi:hypothetical protein